MGKFVCSHLTNLIVHSWDGMDNQQLHHHEGSWKHSLNWIASWTWYGSKKKGPAGTENTTPVIWPTAHPNSGLSQTNSKFAYKAVLLQAWSGPEGSRKLRFPDFMTTAQGGGKVVSLTYRPPLPPGNTPGTHFCWAWGSGVVKALRC